MVRSQKQNSAISHIAKRVDLLACLMVTALAVAMPAVLSLNAFENNWRNSDKQVLTAGMQVLLWNADKQRVKSLLGTPAQIAPPKNVFVEQVSCWSFPEKFRPIGGGQFAGHKLRVYINTAGKVTNTELISCRPAAKTN